MSGCLNLRLCLRFMHTGVCIRILFLLLPSTIPLCVDVSKLLIHLPVDGQLGSFWFGLLGIMLLRHLWTNLHLVKILFLLCRYPRVQLLSYKLTMFNCSWNCQIVFPMICTILHSHQQWMQILAFDVVSFYGFIPFQIPLVSDEHLCSSDRKSTLKPLDHVFSC